MIKNWKTTVSGIASIVSAVALILNNPEQIEIAIGMIVGGLGLIFAKDGGGLIGNIRSEGEESFIGGRPNDR